ncbi:MAG TPA: hypothetical protein VK048_01270 [Atopostipes sp.]|nr:hypothetical protein [Atopostipes sp.]
MKYEDIQFLLFTVKQTNKSIYDVGIDLKEREYRIETTDLYGHIQGPPIEGKLRRSSIERFLTSLNDLNFLSWPRRERGILPKNLKNATVMFNINGEMFYTVGKDTNDLAKLHKAIEQLMGTTFGTYEFY